MDHLVAILLDGACLMDADVGGIRRYDRLIGPQERTQGRLIYLGAPHQKVDVRLWGGAESADGVGGSAAVGIAAIARG